MSQLRGIKIILISAIGAVIASQAYAQTPAEPVNDIPNPYETVENYFKLPAGRTWGSTSAVDVDKDGKTIWVGERCGSNSCANTPELVRMLVASTKLPVADTSPSLSAKAPGVDLFWSR